MLKLSNITLHYVLNWPLPIGAFQGQWNNQRNNRTQQQQLLRIPTGRRQTSWLFTSAAGKLNQGIPGTNSASGQSDRVLNPGSLDLKASTLTTGPHCLLGSRLRQRWTKICVLPKMEEIRLIWAHLLRVSSRYQVTFQKRETSENNMIFVLLWQAETHRSAFNAVSHKRVA